MSQELKKCPCCKGPSIYNEDLNRFYAECHHCQLRTASYRTKDRAAEIWNTRILEAELKQHECKKKAPRCYCGEQLTGLGYSKDYMHGKCNNCGASFEMPIDNWNKLVKGEKINE